MILKSVHIQNFKSIMDSESFSLDGVTCLVGKNESGKTAILQAVSKIKPVVANEANFADLDFPRMTYADYTDNERPKDVLATVWQLEQEDIEALELRLGKNTITSASVLLKKGYANNPEWEITIDYASIIERLVAEADLYAEESQSLANVKTTTELIAELNKITSPSERQAKLLANINALFPEGDALAAAKNILSERMPTFLYFGNYQVMKGEVSLQKLATDQANKTLSMSDRIFIALLEMAGTNADEIQAINQFEPLVAKLEAVSNRLSREIFRYWSQNKHLSIDFRFDAARPQDAPPFNAGYVFRTRIKNTRHGVTVSFDERSTGFVWFFSFLVWFSQVKENYGKNLILLLDEPGLNLHAKAQADLLRYIKEKLAPNHQVIYTTHSPFMVDPGALLSVRTVEDVIKNDELLGTKVSDDVLSTDKDTIFPLQAALGYEISQTLFVGENVLLVEGPSDLLFLQWASDQLRRRKRQYLDSRWVITPSGSIDKISSFIALFGGNKIHIAALTDFAHGDKTKVQRLRDNQLLQSGHVFTVDAYANQPEADIEDLLGRDNYIFLINKCYGLPKTRVLHEKKPSDSPVRVVKEVENHFDLLPAGSPQFDHYTPSVYLVENSIDIVDNLPDLEAALTRFETFFIDLNQLLPKK